MNSNKIFSITIIICLLTIVTIPNARGNNFVWIYEENLNGFKNYGSQYPTYQLYNSFTITETNVINSVGLYCFINPSNATYTEKLKIGIYSNYDSSPNAILSQSEQIPILKSGWLDVEIPEITLTGLVNYWYGVISEGNVCLCSLLYYVNVTNTMLFSKGQSDRVWDNLFNPAEVSITVEDTRFGAFRVGYVQEEQVNTKTFLDIFEHPETYLSGLIVIFLFTLILYFIFKRR